MENGAFIPMPEFNLKDFKDASADAYIDNSIRFFNSQIQLIRKLGRADHWMYPKAFSGNTSVPNDHILPEDPNRNNFSDYYASIGEFGSLDWEVKPWLSQGENNAIADRIGDCYGRVVNCYMVLVGELIKLEAKKHFAITNE